MPILHFKLLLKCSLCPKALPKAYSLLLDHNFDAKTFQKRLAHAALAAKTSVNCYVILMFFAMAILTLMTKINVLPCLTEGMALFCKFVWS